MLAAGRRGNLFPGIPLSVVYWPTRPESTLASCCCGCSNVTVRFGGSLRGWMGGVARTSIASRELGWRDPETYDAKYQRA